MSQHYAALHNIVSWLKLVILCSQTSTPTYTLKVSMSSNFTQSIKKTPKTSENSIKTLIIIKMPKSNQ